jgi:hypothetical protein
MLKIASNGLVQILLERYQIWCDCKNYYESPHTPLVVNSEDGIPCYNYQDLEQINRHRNSLIAIDCLVEGIHSNNFFSEYNKSNRYLIFSNGMWDRSHYNLGIDYRLVHHNFFLFDMADTYNSPNRFCYFLNKRYDLSGSKPYIFVSTIGNIRPERDYLVEKLKLDIQYDNFLLRYSGKDIVGVGTKDVVKFDNNSFDPYTDIISKYYHNVSQTLPIDLLNQGWFNLIVESDLDWTHSFFLTEKTVKNLAIGMPFVLAATPHFLKHLKALGFETYSSLWDESYDEIEDYRLRLDAIVDLCNTLKSFKWEQAHDELFRIGLINRANFTNLNLVADREFVQLEECVKSL